jgi:hypothetical protein
MMRSGQTARRTTDADDHANYVMAPDATVTTTRRRGGLPADSRGVPCDASGVIDTLR